MSDIVERLKAFAWEIETITGGPAGYVTAMSEAAAEIERLREAYGIVRDKNAAFAEIVQDKDIEIERLRDERYNRCLGCITPAEHGEVLDALEARLAEAVALLIAWDNDYPHDINDALDDCAEKTSAFLDKLEGRTDD